MLCTHLLRHKRDGHRLDQKQWQFLIEGFCSGEVTDAQMAAMAMAICIRGIDEVETISLTQQMLHSGAVLPRVTDRLRVDKHSTGGLGDKVSLILAPLLAAAGCDVPMISGRGLGRTGGTLDKLESIEGFRTMMDVSESSKVLKTVGAFIIGADEAIAPADRKLYALRDVTGTVESVGLITASILSKKLAASLDALVMDVKVGWGGFMPTHEAATTLANSLLQVSDELGLPMRVILSDMHEPLGPTIGNAIEVNEAIEVLKSQGQDRDLDPVRQLTVGLAAELLVQVQLFVDLRSAKKALEGLLDTGQAYERFEAMVAAQGGRLNGPLPLADQRDFFASSNGFVSEINCPAIGDAMIAMGGGRRRGGESIDHSVGVRLHVGVGDAVAKGDLLFSIYGDAADPGSSWVNIAPDPGLPRPVILDTLSKQRRTND